MICEHCKCVFCWDDADEQALHGHRKRFCSRTCKLSATKARSKAEQQMKQLDYGAWVRWRRLQGCAFRNKPRYASKEVAEMVARKWSLRAQIRNRPKVRSWRPYLCPCGWWHLTSAKGGKP